MRLLAVVILFVYISIGLFFRQVCEGDDEFTMGSAFLVAVWPVAISVAIVMYIFCSLPIKLGNWLHDLMTH